MLKEFKEFAMKGNVVDLAVGVIIGAAFGRIIESMVADIIMPIIGAIFGGIDFSNWYIGLTKATMGLGAGASYADAKKLGAVLGFGQFFTFVVNFMIVAFVLFLVIKAMNRMKRAPTPVVVEPATPEDVLLLREIRDSLRR